MRAFISTLIFIAAAIQRAHGVLFITAPVGSSKCAAGSPCSITWTDDGKAPTLSQIGTCELGLYVGSQQTQYELQSINPSIDVSKASSFQFTPQASVGGNSDQYFIRFTSSNVNSTSNPMYPYEAFSAKFPISGMTGQFNSTLQQVISQSGGPSSTGGSSSGSMQPTTGLNTTGVSPSKPTSSASQMSTVTYPKTESSTSKSGGAVKLISGPGSSLAVAASLLIVIFSGLLTIF